MRPKCPYCGVRMRNIMTAVDHVNGHERDRAYKRALAKSTAKRMEEAAKLDADQAALKRVEDGAAKAADSQVWRDLFAGALGKFGVDGAGIEEVAAGKDVDSAVIFEISLPTGRRRE